MDHEFSNRPAGESPADRTAHPVAFFARDYPTAHAEAPPSITPEFPSPAPALESGFIPPFPAAAEQPSEGAASLNSGSAPRPSESEFEASERPLPFGTRFLPGTELAIPEALQMDHTFLKLPRSAQRLILERAQVGAWVFRAPPIVEDTDAKTVRFRFGQWERLNELVAKAAPYAQDRRRNLTANSLVRTAIEVFLADVAPHLDLSDVSTEPALEMAVMKAYRRAAARYGL